MGSGGQLQGVALTTQPVSFQGNRDESTNVDMSLVQRDVQVSVVANQTPAWASWADGGPLPCFLREEVWDGTRTDRSGSRCCGFQRPCCSSAVRP